MINNNENIFEGKRSQQANASVRAAFVHVVGDLLQSISVLVSALIIFFKVSPKEVLQKEKKTQATVVFGGWTSLLSFPAVQPEYKMADPICTFLFSLFVLCTTFTIMRDIIIVLMEGEVTAFQL